MSKYFFLFKSYILEVGCKLKHLVLMSLILFLEVIVPKIHAKELKTKEWASPSTQKKFLKITAGCFQMGFNQGFKFEAPVHKICVDSFYLGKYEVTQKQWDILNKNNLSRFKGDNHPVERKFDISISSILMW